MNDRGMKKWRPFNSVVPSRVLLKREENIQLPELSEDEIEEFSGYLLDSMYTHSEIKITFIENNRIEKLEDYCIRFDTVSKTIFLSTRKINFRQIKKIEK